MLAAGCRWVSLREKDLPDDEQIVLARKLLPIARKYERAPDAPRRSGAWQSSPAPMVCICRPEATPRRPARLLGQTKLIGVSIHTVTEAEAIDPACADYALAGPAFETASKPGYGPEIGRKGLGEIARASRVPVLAIGGINAARVGGTHRCRLRRRSRPWAA